MKTPEELREWAETLGQSILNHLERETDYEYQVGDCMIAANPIIEALAQIQRETAEECAGIARNGIASGEITGNVQYALGCQTTADLIADVFGIQQPICNRCGKPKGSAEGCCSCEVRA